MPPLYLIVLFPLLGFVVNGLIGAKLPKPIPGVIASLTILASFAVAAMRFLDLSSQPETARSIVETAYVWMSAGSFKVDVSFLLDQLSGVMILIITGIGFLIHLYSIGYMSHDDQDPQGRLNARYFAWLNLFIAFMSLLVLADNYLLMFVGWEGVGLCSYFLIGYWFKRQDAAQASKKAFIVNRIGDFGFLLGMTLIFLAAGSLNYSEVFAVARDNPAAFNVGVLSAFGIGGLTIITLLLVLGACGKSAQIPLYTWLPDAMAGPTPVSALIHAATMVTAGVYMVARSSILFELAPETKLILCGIGALTALAAGLTALAHSDIKKVLAYSTVSQLGFMFMALGAGAYTAAIFHVFTHAFFKACLFLGAGSVIHALHGEQDMNKMGGLSRKMKATNITFLISGLALAGFPLFAGFFSKDEIIAAVFGAAANESLYTIFGGVALIAAFITALYTGRQYAQVFLGNARDEHLFESAHESSPIMTIPLWILAIGAIVTGYLGVPHLPGVPDVLHAFPGWLSPLFAHSGSTHGAAAAHVPNVALLALGAAIGVIGWLAGVSLGKGASRAFLPDSTRALSLDAVYDATIVRGGAALAAFSKWFDEIILDGVVDGVGVVVAQAGEALRAMQTSYVRNYAMTMALGALVVLAWFLTQSSRP
jgi:NADH-quinone oxidoreductase subunit L